MCIAKRLQLWSWSLLYFFAFLMVPVGGFANPFASYSDDLGRWLLQSGRAFTQKGADEAIDAGRYTADDFTKTPNGLFIPKTLLVPKAPLIEGIELSSGKVSAGEIARVWGIPIRVGEVDVYKLAAPLFYGGLFCIGYICQDVLSDEEIEAQISPLQATYDLIVIDCHMGSCIIYRVT